MQLYDLGVLCRSDRKLVCLLQLRGQPLLHTLEQVTVLPEGREHVRVAETFLDGQGTGTQVDELRCVRMPQVVGAEVLRQPCCPKRWDDDVLA